MIARHLWHQPRKQRAEQARELIEATGARGLAGDLFVEFEYSGYQNMNGVQVPARIVQRQGGLTTFDAAITAVTMSRSVTMPTRRSPSPWP